MNTDFLICISTWYVSTAYLTTTIMRHTPKNKFIGTNGEAIIIGIFWPFTLLAFIIWDFIRYSNKEL